MNGVEPFREVGELLHEELVHLEKVLAVGVAEEVVDHVINAVAGLLHAREIWKAQRAVIVVELERADARRVRLEAEHEDVHHQLHVLRDVLRDAVGGALDVRLVQRGPPALQFAAFACVLDSLFHVSHAVEILIQLALVAGADAATQVQRIREHCIEHALVGRRGVVLEEPVKSQRGIQLQRRRRSRRTPRDMRAVEHRVVLVHRRVRLLAGQHEARHLCAASVGLREQLIEARARADLATARDGSAGEDVARLRTVDVSFPRLRVEQPAHKEHPLAEIFQRLQHAAQLQRLTLALRPPFLRLEAVTRKGHAKPHGSFAGGFVLLGLIAPDIDGFHPGKRHGDADSAQKCAA